jgi:hypothetical protein
MSTSSWKTTIGHTMRNTERWGGVVRPGKTVWVLHMLHYYKLGILDQFT